MTNTKSYITDTVGLSLSPIGGRFGIEIDYGLSKLIGLSFMCDFGYLPGGLGYYAYIGTGITINLGIGLKEE